MFQAVAVKQVMAAVVLVAAWVARAWAVPCPGPAAVAIHADNGSAAAEVTLEVEGEMLPDAAPCDGDGATSYATTLGVPGSRGRALRRDRGPAPRGRGCIGCASRFRARMPQVQRKRSVLLAAPGVPNVVSWTVYPLTVVVHQATDAALADRARRRHGLHDGQSRGSRAGDVRPGGLPGRGRADRDPLRLHAAQPDRRHLPPRATYAPTAAGRPTALAGSNVVVDGLDRLGRSRRRRGADRQVRAIGLPDHRRGQRAARPRAARQREGRAARRGRHRRVRRPGARRQPCRAVHRPGADQGDAITVANQAGAPGGAGNDTVIVASEVTGAEGKGVKVTTGAHLALVDSCVHDNANGGVQALGGTVSAVRNVVQLNHGGAAPHGLLAGVPQEAGPANVLVTDGNVVRFSGGRGISVVNAATATLRARRGQREPGGGRARRDGAAPASWPRRTCAAQRCRATTSRIDVAASPPTCAGWRRLRDRRGLRSGGSCRVAPPTGLGAVVGACDGCSPPVARSRAGRARRRPQRVHAQRQPAPGLAAAST